MHLWLQFVTLILNNFLVGRKGTIITVGSKVAPSLSGVSTKDTSTVDARDSPLPLSTEKQSSGIPLIAFHMAAKDTPAEKDHSRLPPASSSSKPAKDTSEPAGKLLAVPDPKLEWYKLDESVALEGDLSVSGMGFSTCNFDFRPCPNQVLT